MQYSSAVIQARLDAVESTVGTAAKLRIYSGTIPTDCATTASGTLLCEMSLPSDWMNAASGTGPVTKTKLGTWSGTGAATGTAGYWRIYNSAGSVCGVQGTLGIGTGELQLDNTSIATSQAVSVSSFTLTGGNL